MEGLTSAICGGRHFISCLDGRFPNRGCERERPRGWVDARKMFVAFYNARDIYRAWCGAKKGDGVGQIMKADK